MRSKAMLKPDNPPSPLGFNFWRYAVKVGRRFTLMIAAPCSLGIELKSAYTPVKLN